MSSSDREEYKRKLFIHEYFEWTPRTRQLLLLHPFGALPDTITDNFALVFLEPNDLTMLSLTCKSLMNAVKAFRGPLPHISRFRFFPESGPIDSYRIKVYQFLLRTLQHGVIEITHPRRADFIHARFAPPEFPHASMFASVGAAAHSTT